LHATLDDRVFDADELGKSCFDHRLPLTFPSAAKRARLDRLVF
jgi:hypothetical protein